MTGPKRGREQCLHWLPILNDGCILGERCVGMVAEVASLSGPRRLEFRLEFQGIDSSKWGSRA